MRKLLLLLFPFFINAQETKPSEIVNPDGNWFFGAEIGPNIITSYNFGEPNKSFQGGILVEYYTAKHWSLTGRIKYFKTGTSFIKYNNSAKSFNRAVIAIPLDIKYEYNTEKKIFVNAKLGIAYNYGLKSNNYRTSKIADEESTSFVSLNYGVGLSYKLSDKSIIYFELERYSFGDYKGNNGIFILPKNYYAENILLNIGVKHNFSL
jgi:opacity protein-like surface antigen